MGLGVYPRASRPSTTKNLSVSLEDFDDRRYSANPYIDDETYLAAFLTTWFSERVSPCYSTGNCLYGCADGIGHAL